MSEDTVVVPVLSPEWLRKKQRIFQALDEQTIRELETPGTGKTLDELQLVVESRHPAIPPRVLSPLEQLIASTTKKLRRHFGQSVTVDPLPKAVTEENLDKWAAFNLRPVFLPGEEIGDARKFRDYKKPEPWFYQQLREQKIAADSAMLRRGWFLADFTVGTDYTDGTQMFVNDQLSALITKLREAEIIGKHDKTPFGSRFSITNDEWRLRFLPAFADVLSGSGVVFRLERAIEFNAIGNIYDPNRGKFNMWEWFDDAFQGSNRLIGGRRDDGGLACVNYFSAGSRCDHFAGRPLGCFV